MIGVKVVVGASGGIYGRVEMYKPLRKKANEVRFPWCQDIHVEMG